MTRLARPWFGLALPALLVSLLLLHVATASAETLARCGRGWVERTDGSLVLHLAGSPYEMGYQHGALMREHVRENLRYLLEERGTTPLKVGPIKVYPRAAIETIAGYQQRHTAPRYQEEIAGIAAGAAVSERDVRMCNFIPELFHCSGFALTGSATKDGHVLHGRVLDYKCDWHLQDHAVIVIAEPDDGIPLVNITYAGFIGSVTGMNARGISIGEMGGGGFGHWDGTPMALLVREALRTARDLEGAIAVFRDTKRTCEYYYVVADGNTNRAVGLEASWNKFTVLATGQFHPLLTEPLRDTVLLSAGPRYRELVRRAKAGHGGFDSASALRLMDRGVATKSNLHNVLFAPATGDFWVAHASSDGKPAAEQPYHAFNLGELLKRKPDEAAKEIPLPKK